MMSRAAMEELQSCTRGHFYSSDDEITRSFEDEFGPLPKSWAICDTCHGDGGEAFGGGVAFTSSEWAEACDGDEDFAENYFKGRYDEPCRDCGGSGKVKVLDRDQCSAETLKNFDEWMRDSHAANAESLAEKRMGA